MHKVVKQKDQRVHVRLDKIVVKSAKYLFTPYESQGVDENGQPVINKRYFGTLGFQTTEAETEGRKALEEVVRLLAPKVDNIFSGNYPFWKVDQYGVGLQVSNTFKFFRSIDDKTPIPEDEVRNYVYSVEMHFSLLKKGSIYVHTARAIQTGEYIQYDNSLFFDDLPFY